METILVDLPTIRPHQLSVATMRSQTLALVRIRCRDGQEGWGEATTIGGLQYGEESPESVKTNIDHHLAPLLRGEDADAFARLLRTLRHSARGNRFAKCALETALLDLRAQRLGVPLSELLGGRVRDSLPVAWTLASGDTGRDIAEAEAMLELRRHRAFKLKIGCARPKTTSPTCWRSAARWTAAPACASTSTRPGARCRRNAPSPNCRMAAWS